jgi:hypothetical protein
VQLDIIILLHLYWLNVLKNWKNKYENHFISYDIIIDCV